MKRALSILSFLFLILLAIPAAQAQDALTQILTSADGSFSIMYPEGWTASDEEGVITITSDPRLALGDLTASGDIKIVIFSSSLLDELGISGDNIGVLASTLSESLGNPASTVEDLTIGNYTAARVVANSFDNDSEIIGMDFGNGSAIIAVGSTLKGELAKLDATMVAMLATASSGGSSSDVTTTETEATAIPTSVPTEAAATTAATAVPTTTLSLQPELLWTDDTHSINVPSVAFSPDDTSLAVAGSLSADFGAFSDLALVDAATGTVLQTFPGHEQSVSQVAFSPDGTTIASIDLPSLRVWDVATGAERLKIQKDGEFMVNVAYNPQDGSLAYVSQSDPSDTLWRLDLASGQDEALYTVEDRNNVLDGLAFSPDGSTILFGVKDYSGEGFDAQTTVYQLDLATQDAVKVFDHGGVDQLALLYPAEGQPLIAVTPRDAFGVQVWDITTDTLLYSLPEAQTAEGSVVATRRAAISPAGTILATGSINVEGQLWDAQTGAPLATLDRDQELLSNDPMGLAFSHDGSRVAVGYANSTV